MHNFITTSRAAKILDISEAGVRQMADRGELPVAVRAERNGTRLFERSVVEALASRRAERRAVESGAV